MTISLPAEPTGGRDVVGQALARRRHRAAHLVSLKGAPQIGAPLPLYQLTPADAEAADPVAAARQVGWRYPIAGGEAPGLAHMRHEDGQAVFTGVSHGPLARRLFEAAELAQQELGAHADDYQPRLLQAPALRLHALWLAGPTDYFIPLMDGSPPGSAPLKLETDIRPRLAAALALAASRPMPTEGPPSN